MPKRKQEKPPESGFKPFTWEVHKRYDVDQKTSTIKAIGREIEKIELNYLNSHDRLFNDFSDVMSEANAATWVRENGFLTLESQTRRFDDLTGIRQRAADVRWIIHLHKALVTAETTNDYSDLLNLADIKERVHDAGVEKIKLRFPPFQLYYPKTLDETNKLFGRYQLFSDTSSLPGIPIYLKITDQEWKRDRNQCLRIGARNCLRIAVDQMISDVRLHIDWTFDANKQDWILRPVHLAVSPWQAIGIAAMRRICGNTATPKLCEFEGCRKLIDGRMSKAYCNQNCRHKQARLEKSRST